MFLIAEIETHEGFIKRCKLKDTKQDSIVREVSATC